jgi:hypothetical protein
VTDEFLEQFGHDQERFGDLGGYIYHARGVKDTSGRIAVGG